jgi:hypothetical protein
LGWRKFLVLYDQLPAESATATAIRNSVQPDELAERREASDPTRAPWSSTDHLLAAVIDELRMSNYLFASANSKQRQPKPEMVARPGVSGKPVKNRHSIEEMKVLDPRLRGLSDEEALAKFREMTGRG